MEKELEVGDELDIIVDGELVKGTIIDFDRYGEQRVFKLIAEEGKKEVDVPEGSL